MEYIFKQTSVHQKDIENYSNLLSSVFTETKKFTTDFIKWQYTENPNGNVIGFDAYDGDVLVGHYVTIPVVYKINDKSTKGLLSLNTATHPNHQGRGLFTQLAEKTFQLAKDLGYEFVIGVANQNSTPGFLKKLGFYKIAALDVKIGIGSIQSNITNHVKISAVWNNQSIHWRLNNPSNQYFIGKNEVLASTGKINTYAIMSHLSSNFISNKLLKKTVLLNLKLWIGLSPELNCKGIFFNLPDKFKPSPLNLIFKDLSGQLPIFKKEHVHFDLIDFDAY